MQHPRTWQKDGFDVAKQIVSWLVKHLVREKRGGVVIPVLRKDVQLPPRMQRCVCQQSRAGVSCKANLQPMMPLVVWFECTDTMSSTYAITPLMHAGTEEAQSTQIPTK